jgi:predicted Zn-dependent protease
MRLFYWLLFPVRTRRRAAATVTLVLALLAVAGWYGLSALRFQREQTAAREALSRYDFPEARRRLESCLKRRPNDQTTLLLAAQAARRDGMLDDAEKYLDRHQERVSQPTPESALQWALLRVQRGLVKEHRQTLMDYVDVRHPDSEQILEALAQGCVHVYRLDEASFWTRHLLDRFPDNPVGRLIDAQTHESLRRRERAREIASDLVENYPSNDKARLYLAGLLVKEHKYDEAARHYQELLRRQPGQLEPLLGLVRVLVTLERLDEAEPLLRELEQHHADSSEALLTCGRFALRQKRPDEAESFLRRALRLSPNDHEIHYELAVCLRQLKRPEESERHLERYKQIQADMMRLDKVFQSMVKAPSDPALRLEAGRICLRNGQEMEGLRWLYGALDLVPDHKATHAALAEHYESKGDKAQAEYHRSRSR